MILYVMGQKLANSSSPIIHFLLLFTWNRRPISSCLVSCKCNVNVQPQWLRMKSVKFSARMRMMILVMHVKSFLFCTKVKANMNLKPAQDSRQPFSLASKVTVVCRLCFYFACFTSCCCCCCCFSLLPLHIISTGLCCNRALGFGQWAMGNGQCVNDRSVTFTFSIHK